MLAALYSLTLHFAPKGRNLVTKKTFGSLFCCFGESFPEHSPSWIRMNALPVPAIHRYVFIFTVCDDGQNLAICLCSWAFCWFILMFHKTVAYVGTLHWSNKILSAKQKSCQLPKDIRLWSYYTEVGMKNSEEQLPDLPSVVMMRNMLNVPFCGQTAIIHKSG